MTSTETFGARLHEATGRHGSLCVGVDPHPELLEAWGLPDSVDGLEQFSEICVEAFVGQVALVKPQVAFFEAYGSGGLAVLERTVSVLREAGTLVLADAKRGDIGTTMNAYARAWLGAGSPLESDAVTVSPYLGFGSLDPALELAERNNGDCSCWRDVESGGRAGPVVHRGGRPKDQSGDGRRGRRPPRGCRRPRVDRCGRGATLRDAPDLGALPGPILMPGVGHQGGTADDVRRLAGSALRAVVPSVSREVLRAGPSVTALQEAVGRSVDAFAFLQD